MKKFLIFPLLVCAFSVIFSLTARAEVTIDVSSASVGIVTVNTSDLGGKTIKAQVEKDGRSYYYIVIKDTVNLPLQMGVGTYNISVLENVGNDSYRILKTESVSVAEIDEMEMYKASIPLIEYSVSVDAVPAFAQLVAEISAVLDKISLLYNDVVVNYSYDYEKPYTVKPDYVPVIDNTFNEKKGICYDYASILAAALRSQGIPSRLVMGYTPLVSGYHAWNEIWLDDKWVTVDATYDSIVDKAGYEYIMEKDGSQMTIVNVY